MGRFLLVHDGSVMFKTYHFRALPKALASMPHEQQTKTIQRMKDVGLIKPTDTNRYEGERKLLCGVHGPEHARVDENDVEICAVCSG